MGLAVRVIPTLLARGHQLVKGERFQSWRSVGHVQQAVKIHQARGVDELIVLDIAATPAGRGPDFAFIEQLTEECFMPVTVGGGVRSVNDVKRLLACGADKVAIGTAICKVGFILRDCADKFGSQAIVAAVDVGYGGTTMIACGAEHWSHSAVEFATFCTDHGAGEILLTSIDREGTMQGYDLDLIRAVAEAVSIPVIAHGGCSGPMDMAKAVHAGASAVAAGALFQFTDWTPRGCAEYLAANGVEARV